MTDPVIGNRLFTDGTTRDVYLGADGRQSVLGDDGEPAYGLRLVPDDDGADGSAVVEGLR